MRPTRDPRTRPAMQTLERLHAELGGQILENKKEAKRLAAAMVHVEAVLKMLEPGDSVRAIAVRRRKANRGSRRGTVFRAVLDVLRTTAGPLTIAEMAQALLATKGVTEPTPDQIDVFGSAIRASVENHAGGVVVRVGEGVPGRWKISGDRA